MTSSIPPIPPELLAQTLADATLTPKRMVLPSGEPVKDEDTIPGGQALPARTQEQLLADAALTIDIAIARDAEKAAEPKIETLLEQWTRLSKEAKAAVEAEQNLRRVIFGNLFPNPKEGTQHYALPDGRNVKGEYKINRKLEEATLPLCLQALRDMGVGNVDALIKYEPKLVTGEWRSLSPENKLLFADAVIATPGMPTITIEAPKVPKGRKK